MASSIKSVFFLNTKFPITNRLSSFLLLNSELEYSSTSYIEINCHFMDLKQLRVHRRNKTLPFQVSLQLGHFRFSKFISLFSISFWKRLLVWRLLLYWSYLYSLKRFFYNILSFPRDGCYCQIGHYSLLAFLRNIGWQSIIIEKLSVLRSKSDCSTISVRNRYEGSTMQKLTY